MTSVIQVKVWGRTAGIASWNPKRQCATFQYAPDFVRNGYEISPIKMPLSNRTYRFGALNRNTFLGLPGLLADSLPDTYGSTLMDMWIKNNGFSVKDFTSLDRLCFIGRRGMGALEYEPAKERRYEEDEDIDVNLLASLADKVSHEGEDPEVKLDDRRINQLISLGTSAGGARAKAVVTFDEDMAAIRPGQSAPGNSQWILKFDTESRENKKGYCNIEYAYYLMAQDCGIEMQECRLLDVGERSHFITKRFDRDGKEKVHTQTLCALAHYDFKIPAAHSYEDVFAVMREMHMPYSDQEQLFRRMVFNVVMKNCDDHTKNTSFMMRKGERWRLAPAYDLTYAYDPNNYWIGRHQTTINGKAEGITKADILKAAYEAGIKNAENTIDNIIEISSNWNEYAKISRVPDHVTRIIRLMHERRI